MKKYNLLTEEERRDLEGQFLQEPDAFYETAEMAQLRESLKRSYTERFLVMTKLMKLGIMLSRASKKHQPLHSSNNK